MSRSKKADERRISGRVEEILTGWWKQNDGKFERCKTLDVSLEGALVVLDRLVEENSEFELHLDMEADWSVPFDAHVLWQRPIFFGKQQLTAVKYRFRRSEDRSMFGLWLQRQLSKEEGSSEDYLAPVVLNEQKTEVKPVIEPAPRVNLVESRWRKTLSQLTAKIPWTESEHVPSERRTEARGQVGLTVLLESEEGIARADFLNVSLSGAGLFMPKDEEGDLLTLEVGELVDLVVPESNLLLGANRCKAEVVWQHKAELYGEVKKMGCVIGLRFSGQPSQTKQTFVGDLLRRINYNLRQVRSELRFPRELPVVVILDTGERVKGSSIDISAGGARIHLGSPVTTPANVTILLDLGETEDLVKQVTLSSRLLRSTVDNDGRTCYAVAFRKGQTAEHVELSRWLARQLPVQGLKELVPNFSKVQMGDIE